MSIPKISLGNGWLSSISLKVIPESSSHPACGEIICTLQTDDVHNPGKTIPLHCRTLVDRVHTNDAPEHWHRMARIALQQLIMHEVDESLRVEGVPWIDPHLKDRA